MTRQAKTAIKKMDLKMPKNFDMEKGLATVERIIRDNKEWVKEMAAK